MGLTLQNLSDLILWDVIEEHVDEAEFLFERWNRALFQPIVDLNKLAGTFEPRLFAHIDALVIGGVEVAQRVLLPELHAPKDPFRVTVVALTLLSDPKGSWIDEATQAAQRAQGPIQNALIRALVLTDSAQLDSKLQDRFRRNPNDSVLLEILTGRGVDAGLPLRHCLESGDPRLVLAARKAVQRFGRRELYYLAEIGSTSDSSQLYQQLKEQLKSPETIESALWHLGFCGTVEAGDLCATYLDSANLRLVKLAADSIAWIGGLSLSDPKFKLSAKEAAEPEAASIPDFHDDDPGANLEMDGVDSIPLPNAKAIAGWWLENRARLAGYRRCLFGRPFSNGAVRHALELGPLWRRHHLALELSIQTGGREHVSTDSFSARQIRQIAAMVN
jgi:hypothetical protein